MAQPFWQAVHRRMMGKLQGADIGDDSFEFVFIAYPVVVSLGLPKFAGSAEDTIRLIRCVAF